MTSYVTPIEKEPKSARAKLAVLRTLVYLGLAVITFFCLFFFFLMIINCTKSNSELQGKFSLIPSTHFMENITNAFNDKSLVNIWVGMKNSFIVASISAILASYFSALTAYGIHCYQFRLKNFMFKFILVVMMIPSQVSAVGFVALCNKYNLVNTFWPLIVPSIASPVVFFYMKQYMESVLPLEIVEAARVDGAHEFYTFNRIIVPIMMPAIAVQLIFSFVASWNNYFIPAMIISYQGERAADLRTLPIMIYTLRSADYAKFDMGEIYAYILISILPVIVVYLFLSKFIIKGATAGSVKG